jgi:hypothetical protein
MIWSENMSIKNIASECDEEHGVISVTLGDLREAVGAGKLGRWVLETIREELAAAGLGYFPKDLLDDNEEPRQHQQIRIYRRGPGTVARAIEAVLEPSDRGDEVLRELGSDDTREILVQIRRLVGAAG